MATRGAGALADVIEHHHIASLGAFPRAPGRRVALVMGVFDVLHPGHIHLLESAKAAGDVVVAAVFDDASSRLLKGPGRPLMALADRMAVVSALAAVDLVLPQDSLDMESLIDNLTPDLLFIGQDELQLTYAVSAQDAVRRYGGLTVPHEMVHEQSASSIIQSMHDAVDVLPTLKVDHTPRKTDRSIPMTTTFVYPHPRRSGDRAAESSRTISFRGPTADDLIFLDISQWRCFYEEDALRRLFLRTPGDGVVIDVGANIGNHAIFFGAFMARLVIAIEPVPEIHALLVENIALNHLDNVVPIQVALGNDERVGVVFRPPGSGTNSGSIQIRPNRRRSDRETAEAVQIRRLDDLLDEQAALIGDTPIVLLKIDVEGSELGVLMGAVKTIARHRPLIFVELALEATFTAVAGFLATFGYRAIERFGGIIPSYIFVADNAVSAAK